MALWPRWVEALNLPESPLHLDTPLIQLAGSADEAERMSSLAADRPQSGLRFMASDGLCEADPPWPQTGHGAMLSNLDGRVDPLRLMTALRRELRALNVELRPTHVINLQRLTAARGSRWHLTFSDGGSDQVDHVVICLALGSARLLQPLGHDRPMDAVLGQVLELRLNHSTRWSEWPAVLTCGGINLIPIGPDRLWLGATLEPGQSADPSAVKALHQLNNLAPEWLMNAQIVGQWHGLRARPCGRPAPLLEQLEPGLLLASGHYRNGVLLAPATAEWVKQQIDNAMITDS